MPKKPPHAKTKPATLDRIATAIRDDIAALGGKMDSGFQQIRETMATKKDIKELRADLKMATDVMISKADLTEAIREEIGKSEYAREIEKRIHRIEEKLGIEPARR